jgi:hypothetical protein
MPASKKKLDFTNVKDGPQFNSKQMPEGDYAAIITGVEDVTSANDNEMWVYTIKLKDYPRASYPFRCILTEKSIWRVRNLFEAAGVKITKKMLTLDPNRIVGKEIGVALEDDEYEGNARSQITAVMPLDEMMVNNNAPELDDEEDLEEEEEEPTPPKRAAKAAPARKRRAPEPVEEEEDDDEEEDDEPEPPRRTRKAAPAKAPARRRAPAPVEEDEEEEDDEEEEPEPPRKTRSAATRTRATAARKPAPKRRAAPVEEDEDEDEMDIDDL